MRKREGVGSFSEAIEALADRFSVELHYVQGTSPQEEAARRRVRVGSSCLTGRVTSTRPTCGSRTRPNPRGAYLAERGFEEDLLRRFKVGYAPGCGQGSWRHGPPKGVSRQELIDAGLARQSDGGDFFTSRIMFPICDARGRVQGFGGRTSDPNERAKYVNSAEGAGISQATRLCSTWTRLACREPVAGWVAVVEGYTDVSGMAKAGIDNAVACMGTSLTTRSAAAACARRRRSAPLLRRGQGRARRRVAIGRGRGGRCGAAVAGRSFPGPRPRGPGAETPTGWSILRGAVEHPEPMMAYLTRSRIARAGRSAGGARSRARGRHRVAQAVPREHREGRGGRARRQPAGVVTRARGRAQIRGPGGRRALQPAARRRGGARLGPDEARERRWLALAVALPDIAPGYVSDLTEDAFDEVAHRRAFALLASGEPPARWPDELAALAVDLQAAVVDEVPAEAALRESTYRLQERLLERRAQAAREAGQVETFLKLQDLLQRLRQAIERASNLTRAMARITSQRGTSPPLPGADRSCAAQGAGPP